RALVQPPRPTQDRQHPPLNARLRVVTEGERRGIFRDETGDLAAGHAERRWNPTTVPCPQRASVHVPRRYEHRWRLRARPEERHPLPLDAAGRKLPPEPEHLGHLTDLAVERQLRQEQAIRAEHFREPSRVLH